MTSRAEGSHLHAHGGRGILRLAVVGFAFVVLPLLSGAGRLGAEGASGEGDVMSPRRTWGPDDLTPPRLISSTRPLYTWEARMTRVEGTVVLDSVIDEKGNVTRVRVVQGLPMGLDGAAVEAIKRWRFAPATRQGVPVAVRYMLSVAFSISDDFDFGPDFARFLALNPELVWLREHMRYVEAERLLADWPDPWEPQLHIARVYLSLSRQDLAAAWQSLLASDPATAPAEVLDTVAESAALWLSMRIYLQEPEHTNGLLVGLEAATVALNLDSHDTRAMLAKSALLRLQANRAAEEWKRGDLLDEARDLQTRAQAERPPS
jgi:TonB family protein